MDHTYATIAKGLSSQTKTTYASIVRHIIPSAQPLSHRHVQDYPPLNTSMNAINMDHSYTSLETATKTISCDHTKTAVERGYSSTQNAPTYADIVRNLAPVDLSTNKVAQAYAPANNVNTSLETATKTISCDHTKTAVEIGYSSTQNAPTYADIVRNLTPVDLSTNKVAQAYAPANNVKTYQSRPKSFHESANMVNKMSTSTHSPHNQVNVELLNIEDKTYKALNVPGDGNCFFHCLSLVHEGDFTHHEHYRRQICGQISQDWAIWKDTVSMYHDKHVSTQETYQNYMVSGNGWATCCEIEAASQILGCNISTWLKGSRYNVDTHQFETCYNQHVCSTQVENSGNIRNVDLLLENSHFKLLVLQETLLPIVVPTTKTTKRKHINAPIHTKSKKCKLNKSVTSKAHDQNKCNLQHIASSRGRVCTLTEEELLCIRCRALGLSFKYPQNGEDRRSWKRKIVNSIKQIKKIFHIDDEQILPPPPLLTCNEEFNTAMDSIRSFELEQLSYTFQLCHICMERKIYLPSKKANICKRCSQDKGNVAMFSKANNMDPGLVPQELTNLTLVEQQLICRIAPSINVHLLKHGGLAANGHCVSFPQAIDQPSQIFPKLPHEINIIRVRREGKNDTNKEFKVRRYTVQSALVWLKTNNPAYSDIIISQERLNTLPIDGHYSNIHTVEYKSSVDHLNDKGPAPYQVEGNQISEEETISGVILPDPKVDIRKEVEAIVADVVGSNHGDVTENRRGTITIPWPTRNSNPVSEFTKEYFFTMAFPCLFPFGTGDFYINRRRTCTSMSDWAEHLLWYSDGRFAHHKYFKFIVHNMVLRKRVLEQSSFIVRQQLGDENLTVQDLKDKLVEGNDSTGSKIIYFGACLRGTSQYWTQRSKELRSLIQFQINEGKGLPSFFTTGSCAEYYFKPLRRLLQMYIEETTNTAIDLNNSSALFAALQKNTHIVGKYFDMRTQSYFRKVMGPVFNVDTFWYRQEFAKSRGMIHWHGLCWRSDREPHNLLYEALQKNLSEDDTAKELAYWAKSVFGLTANHPAGTDMDGNPRKDMWPPPEGTGPTPPEDKNPLVKLLMDVSQSQETLLEDHILMTNRVNIHRCSNYCLRSWRNHSEKICRMDFGTSKNPGKEIRSSPAIIKDKNGSLRLEMERDHPTLVQHSRYHTQAWRANGDISIILSKSDPKNPSVNEIIATEKYVSGYACKGNEPTGAIVDMYNDLVHSADEDEGATAKSICTKLLMHTVKRDISAVEASYELSSLPLYRCSHQFQSISMSGSRVLEKKGTTVTKSTPLDKYLGRSKEDKSSWYTFICKRSRVPVISGSTIQTSWPLTKEYCRTMLLLHWPNWRQISDITNETTWVNKMEEFIHSGMCPSFVKADIERAKRKELGASYTLDNDTDSISETDDYDEQEQPDWMDNVQPNAEFSDKSHEFMYDDGGLEYDWNSDSAIYPIDHAAKWFESIDRTEIQDNDILKLPNISLSTMNKCQILAFNIVMETLQNYKVDNLKYEPLRLIVAGTAGSGKSYLINCLVKAIRTLFDSNKSVQVLCPTGNSANLISGVTIHSFLKIPIGKHSSKEMKSPDGAIGEALQRNCDGLVALLVDERSLIGCTTLGWMEFMTSCAIKHNTNSTYSWGGLPVVVFLGDDVQLPPVCDSPVYHCKRTTSAALHGALVWKQFSKAVILSKVIRQDNDQLQFKDTLSSLRTYTTTPEQAKWLQTFQWNKLSASYGNELLSNMMCKGLFVFPSHSEEWSHNKAQILHLNNSFPIAKITAMSSGSHAKSTSTDKAGGLAHTLYICQGAKVMLTCNLNVSAGLFNGSFGMVKHIIYDEGTSPKDSLPQAVMVEFPKYTGPAFVHHNPKLIPIVPVERRIDCRCYSCKRKQIPLRLGWGTTIHRCQGMTIGSNESNRYIIINPGTKSFESRNPGALFVALSRAKSAGGNGHDPDFAFHPDILINEDRLCHVVKTPTTLYRKKEMQHIKQLAEETKQTFMHLDNGVAFPSNDEAMFIEE